jgi:hypothetical protein
MNRAHLVGVMPLVVAEQILPDLHPDPFLHAAPEIAIFNFVDGALSGTQCCGSRSEFGYESGNISQTYGFEFGSFYLSSKNSKKNIDSYGLITFVTSV